MNLIVVVMIGLISISSSTSSFFAIGTQDYTLYTEAEQNALKEFRPLVSDVIVHDYERKDSFLINWLRARSLDLNEASQMYHENQKWRKANKIDTIVNETIFDFNPPAYTIDGFDKEGHSIIIFSPIHVDLRHILIQGKRDKIIRFWWQMLEKTAIARRKAAKQFGTEKTKAVAIVDLQGFNRVQHFCLACLTVYTDWFRALEKYQPESVKHFIIINLPRVAVPFVELIRPLLSPSSTKALKVFPPDKRQWSKFLLQIADSDQLPYRFGGTRKT